MIRKLLLLVSFSFLLMAESAYFARACAAGVLRLRGEHALHRNDHLAAWRLYQRAIAWGGDRDRLETDVIELILFGLDQAEGGIRVDMALRPGEAVRLAHDLVARRIGETPYRAYYWSLASDIYWHEGSQRRREIPLDLASLSDDPLQNLMPEQRLALAARRTAGLLEPNNPLYHDLLVETYLELGSSEHAVDPCRRALAAYPAFDGHSYLRRTDLAPALVEAAAQGFEEALAGASMSAAGDILVEAGRFMTWHRRTERAVAFFDRALAIAPDHYDARLERGIARFGQSQFSEALQDLERAAELLPERYHPHYWAGVTRRAMGDLEGAITDLRKASEAGYGDLNIFRALGETLEAQGRIEEARRQFVAAANLHPGVPEAWTFLLSFHLRQRDLKAASESCSRISALMPAPAVLREQCDLLSERLR